MIATICLLFLFLLSTCFILYAVSWHSYSEINDFLFLQSNWTYLSTFRPVSHSFMKCDANLLNSYHTIEELCQITFIKYVFWNVHQCNTTFMNIKDKESKYRIKKVKIEWSFELKNYLILTSFPLQTELRKYFKLTLQGFPGL